MFFARERAATTRRISANTEYGSVRSCMYGASVSESSRSAGNARTVSRSDLSPRNSALPAQNRASIPRFKSDSASDADPGQPWNATAGSRESRFVSANTRCRAFRAWMTSPGRCSGMHPKRNQSRIPRQRQSCPCGQVLRGKEFPRLPVFADGCRRRAAPCRDSSARTLRATGIHPCRGRKHRRTGRRPIRASVLSCGKDRTGAHGNPCTYDDYNTWRCL